MISVATFAVRMGLVAAVIVIAWVFIEPAVLAWKRRRRSRRLRVHDPRTCVVCQVSRRAS